MAARLTILLLLLAAALRAQSPSAVEEPAVTGYVLAPDGTPVSEGTVIALSGSTRTTAAIDRTGRFRLVILRSGVHQIVVSAPGLTPYRVMVNVPASRFLRMPVVHLAPGGYFRVRLVSPAGELITAPQFRRRFFDVTGNTIPDALGDRIVERVDDEGFLVVGPLPRGIMTMAVDNRFFAQTRLPDVTFDGAVKVVDAGTITIQQPGEVLNVDVVDETGAPVPEHDVRLEDTLPLSPLAFRPVRTNRQGRATFDRLAAGRYLVSTTTVERCANQTILTVAHVVALSGAGTGETRLVVGGRAAFRIMLPLFPSSGASISAAPNVASVPLPSPLAPRPAPSGCRGTTDTDGRVTLTNFPPGPAHVEVHMVNSTYVRQLDVPSSGQEMTIHIPDGYLPVRVVNALTNRPVPRASIAWTGGGARVEGTATVTGEALLEGVGTEAGTLAVSASGYEPAEEQLAEPPGIPHDIAMKPVAPRTNLRPRVMTTSGEPLPNAVVQLITSSPADVPSVAVSDAKGIVVLPNVPSGSLQLIANADGYVTSKTRVGEDRAAEIVLMMSAGYRVVATVELPAAEGPQVVRIVNDAGVSMDDVLDIASDRGFEPPGGLSLGPLAPGAYVVELYGARGRRQEPVRIVNEDAHVMFR